MKKSKAIIVLATSLTVVAITSCVVQSPLRSLFLKAEIQDGYVLTLNSKKRLDGGNVKTKGGTNIHFDEYGVDENPSSGLLELAAYGSISLQTYISGIASAEVTSEQAEGKDFYLTVGATPNSCEYTYPSYNGHCQLNLQTGLEGNCFYFSVHNKTENPIIIEEIKIGYSCEDSEADLKRYVSNLVSIGIDKHYNGSPFNPYKGYPVDPSRVPSDRYLIPTMSEDEYPDAPGHYTFGYGVYDVTSGGQPRKLLYTITNTFHLTGENLEPIPDGTKVLTFHIPDENGKEKLIHKSTKSGNFDITDISEECLQYSWDSPYNAFKYIGEEHYYPVFRVNGLSANKEGDGCYPVHTTYSYLERGFTMPEPQMKPGYKFGGWYTDFELTQVFDENNIKPGNLTLYAKCIETDKDIRRVYYHNEDGSLSNHIDYLTSDNEKLELPEASTIMDLPRPMIPLYWAVYCDTTYIGLYKQHNFTPGQKGDTIQYSNFNGHSGDVHIYATEVKRLPKDTWTYDLFSVDEDGNNIYQHTMMASSFKRDYDFIIPGFVTRQRGNYEYHDQADSFTVNRTGQFFMTDEKKAFIIDGGTLKTIASYAYANIDMKKPLAGILRHETVKKVGRRAFFNRYGMKGTYFPKNATEFEIEAYANVEFNNKVLTLPKTLTRIGDRCFIGATNYSYVCLPRTIKTIGRHAFSWGTYNHGSRVFENIKDRTEPGAGEAITFLYEGSEADFNKLDEVTKEAITKNAYKIVYNYSYGTYYGRG